MKKQNRFIKAFSTLFKPSRQSMSQPLSLNTITFGSNDNVFSLGEIDISSHPDVRAVVSRVASDMGRTSISHVVNGVPDRQSLYSSLLNTRPNELESPTVFLSKLVYKVLVHGNVYVDVVRDKYSALPTGYFVLDIAYSNIEKINGKIYLVARLKNGEPYVKRYSEILHLKMNCDEGTMGKSLLSDLNSTLSVLAQNNKIIQNQFNNYNKIKGFIQSDFKSTTSFEDLELIKGEFIESAKNSDGVAVMPLGTSFIPVKQETINLNIEEIKEISSKINKHFNVSTKVLDGTATKEELACYVNTVVDPLARALSQELTYKVLTSTEVKSGERLEVSTLSLLLANAADKGKYFKDLSMAGITAPDELRRELGLDPIKGGDELRIRRDTAPWSLEKEIITSKHKLNKGGGDNNGK